MAAVATAGARFRGQPKARAPGAVEAVTTAVGLDPSILRRYPHELSGGQLRRVALARILLLSPKLVIFSTSRPRASICRVQATVLRFFRDMRDRLGPDLSADLARPLDGAADDATASPSCISAASSRSGRPLRCSTRRAIPTSQALLAAGAPADAQPRLPASRWSSASRRAPHRSPTAAASGARLSSFADGACATNDPALAPVRRRPWRRLPTLEKKSTRPPPSPSPPRGEGRGEGAARRSACDFARRPNHPHHPALSPQGRGSSERVRRGCAGPISASSVSITEPTRRACAPARPRRRPGRRLSSGRPASRSCSIEVLNAPSPAVWTKRSSIDNRTRCELGSDRLDLEHGAAQGSP